MRVGGTLGGSGRRSGVGGRWVWRLLGSMAMGVAGAVGVASREACAAAPVVSNVRAAQRLGTMFVEIGYDVADADGDMLRVSLSVSEDGGRTYAETMGAVSGDVGFWIVPGTSKRVVWEAGVDWLGRATTNMRFRVSAEDSAPVPGMVWIPPGTFTMGSPAGEPGRESDEGSRTEVTLTKGYWLGKYEVTQGEWTEVMGSNPSYFKGDPNLPVENVSWEEARAYCAKVTERERAAGRLPKGYAYALPTEAQWEYACRAGTRTATAYGDSLSSRQANFHGNYPYNGGAKGPYLQRTAKAGSYLANGWGLYDAHGNVWEWCLDWYADKLPGGLETDPKGPAMGLYRVVRGGSWAIIGQYCRSADRDRDRPSYRDRRLGFRLALVAVP